MTLRHLEILVSVAQEQSVTKAAKKLFISQPAVSLAISELEKEYSIKIFDRINKKMFLTDEGERLYRWASQLLSVAEDMDGDMKNHNRASRIRIGSSITFANNFFMPLIIGFEQRHPNIKAHIQIASVPVIKEMIMRNELDIALTEDFSPDDGIVQQELFADKIVPVCCNNHRFCSRKISPAQLSEERLIVKERGAALRQIADSIITINNLSVTPYMEAADNFSIILAVEKGLGISFMPENLVKEYIQSGKLGTFSLIGKKLDLSCRLIHHKQKSLSPSVTSFIDFCMNNKREYSGQD